MKSVSSDQITKLLEAWHNGDRSAEEKLWPLVYRELKLLARRKMRRERDSHTLQTDALVNEVYLRLVNWEDAQWQGRGHFFGMCARMMRQILIDHARARSYQKRGGDDATRLPLDGVATLSESGGDQLLALDEALTNFAASYPRQSQVVELRFFGGLSAEDAAAVLNVSVPTVVRDWKFARAWLASYLKSA